MAKAAKKRSVKQRSVKPQRSASKRSAKKQAPKKTAGKKAGKKAPARKAPEEKAAAKKASARRAGTARARAAAPSRTRTARPPQTRVAKKKAAARAAGSRRAAKAPAAAKSALGSAATMIRGAVAGAVAAVTQKLPWTSDQLDALQLLERDHRRFEELLRQGEETTERAVKGRRELLDTITRELNEHELKEEKFLYPVLKAHPQATEIVLEGYQEHHVADVIVRELHDVAADDERWGAKFKVLKENIEHHIQEEEGEMFRIARAALSREELLALGERMTKGVPGR